MLNIVVINGGRGAATIIPAFLSRDGLNLTSIVNAYDDGKSTGEVRSFFGMLGPSDIRKVQELMLPESDPGYAANLQLFKYRYPESCERAAILRELAAFADGSMSTLVGVRFGRPTVENALRHFIRQFLHGLAVQEKAQGRQFNFSDCSIMNCVYAGAYLTFERNIESAAHYINRLFRLKGTVLPTNIEDKKLVALRENGDVLCTEAEIVELRSNVRIRRIYLLGHNPSLATFEHMSLDEKEYYLECNHCFVGASEGVIYALRHADIIMYAPGTQHSSLYPTYLSSGVASAIADNKAAVKVFVTNIGADYETPGYRASDYINDAFRYLCLADKRRYAYEDLFDAVLINQPRNGTSENHVKFDKPSFAAIPVRRIVDCFEDDAHPGKHDGQRVVQTALDLYEEMASPISAFRKPDVRSDGSAFTADWSAGDGETRELPSQAA
jgi:2-phospho-L-lactate transferase/gluconeogenesis factor (CofD/UPF0052 family)